jgi:predicted DsbA family dithiol-disulfide isomerase
MIRPIEVFADIWCQFAHVGLRLVVAQRAAHGRDDVALVVRAWPLELVNGRPLDPAKTLEHVHELRAEVAPDLFAGFDPDRFPSSTLEALALVERAYRRDAALGEQASFAVRDALFERGEDVADPDVLARLADELGIEPPDTADRDAVLTDWHEGQARGVVGSPHFYCGELDAFCPSLDISRDRGPGLTITVDTHRLHAFLDACFGETPAAT